MNLFEEVCCLREIKPGELLLGICQGQRSYYSFIKKALSPRSKLLASFTILPAACDLIDCLLQLTNQSIDIEHV
jgi:hypothetical protein